MVKSCVLSGANVVESLERKAHHIMKINTFDKNTCKALRNELNTILTKYGVDTNLVFEVGNMKYLATEVTIKLTARVAGAKPNAVVVLERNLGYSGLNSTNAAGDELVGYKPANYRYPFIYVCGGTGRRFKCSEESATKRFGKVSR
jgi:hypothetical protein